MAILKRCWTPLQIYSYTTVKLGCYYTAVYTAIIHILIICYSLYVIDGGKSDDFYSPYFELNKSGAALAGSYVIVFSFLFILACIMLALAVKRENRCMFFPWMIGMVCEILVMLCVGIWFMFRYYYNPKSFIATAILWSFDGLHLYCLLCVISQYQILEQLQEPRFIVLHP